MKQDWLEDYWVSDWKQSCEEIKTGV